jgi:hypothetical protein
LLHSKVGASTGDEVEYEFADHLRGVVVEKIEKKAARISVE